MTHYQRHIQVIFLSTNRSSLRLEWSRWTAVWVMQDVCYLVKFHAYMATSRHNAAQNFMLSYIYSLQNSYIYIYIYIYIYHTYIRANALMHVFVTLLSYICDNAVIHIYPQQRWILHTHVAGKSIQNTHILKTQDHSHHLSSSALNPRQSAGQLPSSRARLPMNARIAMLGPSFGSRFKHSDKIEVAWTQSAVDPSCPPK